MPHNKAPLPDDLLQLSQRLQEWRSANPPRTRLPEAMWTAAVEMAQRHGLHRTTKSLRLDYMRLKRRLSPGVPSPRSASPAFLELLPPPASGSTECVVEWESARSRMRIAMKGGTLDWASLLQAWRETEA
jgi:hypothetical protein